MSVYKKYVNVQGGQTPFISGSKGGGCFPAGSLVSTTRGEIPIEDIKINDKVYCFDENDKRWVSFVEKTWEHVPSETVGYILTITHEKGVLRVTDNHYLYDENNEYKEAKDWAVGEYLTLEDNDSSKILSIESEDYLDETVYNLTVNTYHNYICQGIRLSNKGGGGKGGGGAAPAAREDPNTLFSTDILFLTVALGEGPIYRINPNGPQDIEINEGVADDLINIEGDGTENNEVFKTLTTTGTLTQGAMDVFGAETVTPQNLNNPVGLKNGNVAGIPKASVILQSTSAKDWDALRFNFVIQGLQKSDANGNVSGTSVTVKITVFDSTGVTTIAEDEHTVSGKTNTRFKFQRDIVIPDENKSTTGYKFTVEKTSGDSDSNRIADNIQFVGWDEIEYDDMAYPRTALIGYAIKSFNEHEGRVPTFSSLIKGLLVKVPSNYNQPILSNGEIDWRQLEVPETGAISIDGDSTQIGYTQQGYQLQTTIEGVAQRKVSLISGSAGTGYASDATPSVTISGGGGSGASATANVGTNKISSFTLTSAGSGYTTAPTVTVAAPAAVTFNGASAVSDGSDTITVTGHPFATGDQATYSAGGGTAISGTGVSVASGGVFIIKINANTVKLATSASNANAGTAINITSGSGTSHTLTGMTATATATLTSEQFNANPVIYQGVWDGTFVYSWTQNPVWIIYDILTNQTYGLGIEEENIDKFMFYKVAQYCDCCDATTGKFTGVDGFGDGTFRHKPRNLYTTVKETLVGLPRGVQVKERRFISDLSIQEDVQVMDTINKITSTFRGLLYYSAGKVTLNVDMPDDVPVAIFNDANIKKDTLKFSGTKESDIITGCDISYIEPSNHFKREVVRIDDQEALRDRNQIENIKQMDLAGVTRRSQASRYGQYMIAASKFLRRQVEFVAGADALNLTVGDVVTVATKSHGLAYGFGGKVAADSSTTGNANILLEHFTSPSITSSTFTSNTQPLAIRVIKMDSDRIDYYIVSNTAFQTLSTSNADSGVDLVEVTTISRWNYNSKGFVEGEDFLANNVPQKGDLWTFGEVNPDNFYDNQNDRLFKITTIGRNEDEEITVTGIEYISNVYVDSDSLIAYVPVRYDDTVSSLTPPPTPELNLQARPRRVDDGSVTHDILVDISTDQTGYPLFLQTEVEIGRPDAIFSSYLTSGADVSPKAMTASNTSPLANGEISILSGKNGFKTNTGEIRLICDAVDNPDVTDTSNGNVVFKVASLHQVRDTNFMKHVLEVNDGITFDSGLKGFDKVAFDLNQKSVSSGGFGFVDHGTRLVNFTANVIGSDLTVSNGSIIIENEHSGDSTVFNSLPTPPFFVTLNQLVDTRFFDNREMYIAGTSFTEIQSNVITGNLVSGTNFIQPLVRGAPFKESVRVFVDGLQIPTSAWNFTSSSNDSVTITGLSDEVTSRVEADYYTVPTVELGDNLQFFSGNVYSIVDTTYSADSPSHNVALTSNNIYRVKLGSKLLANTRGTTAINISNDPVGVTNNVIGSAFTFDYDTNLYPGSFSLANNAVYSILTPADFDSIGLPADRLLKNQDPGLYVFRARNINNAARKSAPATESILINQVPIQKVENLEITESLYIEQTVGAAVRININYDHITDQEVTDYEISYKLGGAAEDLTNFQTVKVSSQGVDPDGKIRFAINNVDRGSTSGINNITVRVTPLNGTIRGVTLEKTQSIAGKTAPPQNVSNFSVAQVGEELQFSWAYVKKEDGSLFDVDLRDIVIKRASGPIAEANFASTFVTASEYIVVSSGSTKKSAPIDTFGTFTYLAKTRDTSGNLSDTVVGVTFTSTKLSSLFLLQAYSEDAPNGNVFVGIPNTNRGEFNFPSFANSNTGGLSSHFDAGVSGSFNSHIIDNANGTTTGYSAISGSPTDLLAESSATYQTPIRDIGQVKTISFTANIVGTATTTTTFNSLHTNIAFGIVEPQDDLANASILHDTALGGSQGIGTVLGFSNTSAATVTYSDLNETLTSGGASGNVYAIWNASQTTDGQHVDDTSNANSYALIASVINADAVLLGEVFHANGVSTGGNTFANLTTKTSSYKLVDLNQFSDASVGSTTFLGDSNALDTSVIELRTSETDPFFANGNVNISTFQGNLGDRFQNFAVGDRRARFFQFKHTVTNSKPQEVNYTLDKFEYTVDSPSKEFRTRVTFAGDSDTGGNTAVDYTSTDFFDTPTFSATIVSTANVSAAPVCFVLGSTRTGANINVIFSSNSEPAVGTVVDLIALGT